MKRLNDTLKKKVTEMQREKQRLNSKQYREANKEKEKIRKHKWYLKNKERVKKME